MYGYSDIHSFLQTQTGKVVPKDKDSDFIFTLYFDMTILRVVILMHENYELDLSQGAFAELLGYKKKILIGEKNYVGTIVPNITRSVDWVFLHGEQTMFQAMCYTISQQQGFRLAIHFKKSCIGLSGIL